MTRSAPVVMLLAVAALGSRERMVHAHSGPPFPVVSNQLAGPYIVSIWTDPDTTDDGRAAGQFWVTLEAAGGAKAIPAGTRASVEIHPLDRQGPAREGRAEPVGGSLANQFVALVMDHEGPYGVRVTIDGPLGGARLESRVDATYDLRPAPMLIALYLFPFLALGALWMKVLRRRRDVSRNR